MAEKPKCFIIMPISTPADLVDQYSGDNDHFKHVLESLFIPAVKAADMTPIPPLAEGANVIHARIINQLETAKYVLCDISSLNANVFFELGIRVAMNKPLIYVRDELTKIPFDTGVVNHYQYDSQIPGWKIEKEREQLASHIRVCKDEPGKSLFDYFSLSAAAHLRRDGDIEKDRIDYLTLKVDEISKQLRHRGSAFQQRIDFYSALRSTVRDIRGRYDISKFGVYQERRGWLTVTISEEIPKRLVDEIARELGTAVGMNVEVRSAIASNALIGVYKHDSAPGGSFDEPGV